MKKIILLSATMAASACAHASGMERTNQGLAPLFEKGRSLSVEAYTSRPNLQGTDALRQSTGSVAPSYTQWGFAYKQDLNPQTAVLLTLSRPFGLDIDYDRQQSPVFGGTQAKVRTLELLGALHYQWSEHWGVHGGLRLQRSEGHVALGGAAFGPLQGYRVDFQPSTEPGYLLGLSYAQPDLGLRITGTYYSEIKHRVRTTENVLPGVTTHTPSMSPESFTLDLQTGITPNTLLFGQVRWTHWAQFQLSPQAFAAATRGGSLTDVGNSTTYTVGMGHRLNAQWSGFVAVAYNQKTHQTPLSPLQPSTGRVGYTLGVSYQGNSIKITPWVSYQRLGGTEISSTSTPMARMEDGHATAFGVKLGYSF